MLIVCFVELLCNRMNKRNAYALYPLMHVVFLQKASKFDRQFRRFASREYLGVLYMTSNDFLQSLFQEQNLGLFVVCILFISR